MKKKWILGLIIILLTIILILLKDFFVYQDDWALCNYGQTINEKTGTRGIDIKFIKSKKFLSNTNCITTVAVVDSGMYDNLDAPYHNALQYGWDFYNNDNTVYDSYLFDYHGTYIANTIFRINKNIQIIPVKFMSESKGNSEDCIKALEYAIHKGASVINCSWCFDENTKALKSIVENNPEVIFIVSAGNERVNLDEQKIYPCCYEYDNIISVGAINSNGDVTDFSGYGSYVDIMAPGDNIKIILPENDVSYIDGTSVATALVSGVVTSLLSNNPELTPMEVKQLLLNTSTKMDKLENLCNSGGYLNMYEALKVMEEHYE